MKFDSQPMLLGVAYEIPNLVLTNEYFHLLSCTVMKTDYVHAIR